MSEKDGKGARRSLHDLISLQELRIVVIYVVLGCTWIIGSDLVVERLANETPRTILMHSVKGLNFVVTTGILLYFTLHRAFSHWRWSERRRREELEQSERKFRELSARLQDLREEERTRIAREIHDEFGQQLTAVKLRLGLLERLLERSDEREWNRASDLAVELSELVDESMHSVRRVASGLRPQALDHLGLGAALREEAREFIEHAGIPCELELGPMDRDPGDEVKIATFRVFQELLTNVARHAGAERVAATCGISDDRLVLKVVDDGVGMDPDAAGRKGSLGLVGMRERASQLGGTLAFDSAPGRGTAVTLDIPLAARGDDAVS